MKPISLTMQAFGPYRDTISLDFNALEGHSMFLISGPTGGGGENIYSGCHRIRVIWRAQRRSAQDGCHT
nr:hypothetical protein [Veillonella denticariosi]